MYAYSYEIGRGFFEGVRGRCVQPLESHDPPLPIRESSPTSASSRRRTGLTTIPFARSGNYEVLAPKARRCRGRNSQRSGKPP